MCPSGQLANDGLPRRFVSHITDPRSYHGYPALDRQSLISIGEYAMRSSTPRILFVWTAVAVVVATAASPAQAAFHLWAIQEVYTNNSGTLQFIELVDSVTHDPFGGGQNFVGGQSI